MKKALAAGVTVIGVDAGAKGALVNLTVDHTAAGRVSRASTSPTISSTRARS